MPARYVYWRQETGRAHKSQDDKYAPRVLLADIGKNASINDEGNVSWGGMAVMRFEHVVLGSMIVLDRDERELNQHDTNSIVWSAMRTLIKECGGRAPIEPKPLIDEANRQAAEFFRKPQERFYLVTSLPVNSLPTKQIAIDQCRITLLRSRHRYPVPGLLKSELERDRGAGRAERPKHQLIRVSTSGRSMFDAADRALEAVGLLCGLWNLMSTYRAWSIRFGGRKPRPLGVIHPGPYHTLHKRDGKPIEELYWYEPDYGEHLHSFGGRGKWDKIEKDRRWAVRRLKQVPYREDLRALILRYAGALSKTDPDVAFLQMWSILEKLTDSVGARYDKTIRRAVWTFSDREVAKELLASLRRRRNQYVHASRSDEDREEVAQLMKFFIDPHLLRLLRNDFRVENLREYAEALTLPASINLLARRRALLRRAIGMLKQEGDPS